MWPPSGDNTHNRLFNVQGLTGFVRIPSSQYINTKIQTRNIATLACIYCIVYTGNKYKNGTSRLKSIYLYVQTCTFRTLKSWYVGHDRSMSRRQGDSTTLREWSEYKYKSARPQAGPGWTWLDWLGIGHRHTQDLSKGHGLLLEPTTDYSGSMYVLMSRLLWPHT